MLIKYVVVKSKGLFLISCISGRVNELLYSISGISNVIRFRNSLYGGGVGNYDRITCALLMAAPA